MLTGLGGMSNWWLWSWYHLDLVTAPGHTATLAGAWPGIKPSKNLAAIGTTTGPSADLRPMREPAVHISYLIGWSRCARAEEVNQQGGRNLSYNLQFRCGVIKLCSIFWSEEGRADWGTALGALLRDLNRGWLRKQAYYTFVVTSFTNFLFCIVTFKSFILPWLDKFNTSLDIMGLKSIFN